MARPQNTPEYRIWDAMIQRCTNPKDKNFKNYGGRGIEICERWYSFADFFADVGKRPPGRNGNAPLYTFDRIDNDRGYEPGNWRWATHRQQVLNRRYFRPAATKLTIEQVHAIRADPRSHRAIAADYSVSHHTIGTIKRGVVWRSAYRDHEQVALNR